MRLLLLPWLELAIVAALVGALIVGRLRSPDRAARGAMAASGIVFGATFLAWLAFDLGVQAGTGGTGDVQARLFGQRLLALDELTAPLVPSIALLNFLTALATARARVRQFSFAWLLAAEAGWIAIFAIDEPRPLIALLVLMTLPPYLELRKRGRPTRVYVIHNAAFIILLVAGWAAVEASGPLGAPSAWALAPLLAAILIRCATVPAHCWLTDWFEHATLADALLFVAPLGGIYAAVRLVVPIGPDWVLRSIGLISLTTAVYAAGMAAVARETRRFFAYLFLSHASLVLVGLELHTVIALTGALGLWFSVILALGGFGLSLNALESRFGRLALSEYHGLYEHAPSLAVSFLLTGLASVGFPGTLAFISAELLVDGAIAVSPMVGVGIVAVAALNGIAVMRAYFRLFTGARHVSTVSLQIVPRERLAVLSLAALILGGGLFPQPGIASRHRAAAAILDLRRALRPEPIGPDARDRDANAGPTERQTTRRRGRAGLISGPLTGPVIDR
jgi:NADH-quinone oxidoreductase subunit M